MMRIHSDLPPSELVAILEKHSSLRRAALLEEDTPAANRHADKIYAALNALAAKGEEGRRAFEQLLTHPMPHIRLYAAGKVIRWAPDAAVPVLGRLLVEKLDDKTARWASVDVRMSASRFLMEFFGVKSFKEDDLIEPLKAYGIDLPKRPVQPWT